MAKKIEGASEFLAQLFTALTNSLGKAEAELNDLREVVENLENEVEYFEQENADLHLQLDALRSSYAGAPSDAD